MAAPADGTASQPVLGSLLGWNVVGTQFTPSVHIGGPRWRVSTACSARWCSTPRTDSACLGESAHKVRSAHKQKYECFDSILSIAVYTQY